ncbi:periplasmic binding protein [Anaeromyxobacter dehalogenans 2CP-1]|uniref:Periplasmic binding protein n=1 Tax=Anaeromyxobacter dehalogenans (strain ATCC BAA-258 / DSM 21875 / 2CP-1) TaxID=455488 RepID=B8J650_ANAD2|nr:helical backbone metal receptor [Anaeromyxobacter dehalogenans]ACL66945.1 periplasmic binding protein [Anaeromyxobacter dehalogenans 2CP-1]
MRAVAAGCAALALALAAPAARAGGVADLLRPSGRGAAEGGTVWAGPRPSAPPRRVVVLAPSLTDVVLALGLGDRLVGVTQLDDAPEVRHVPRVGGFIDPNPEAILGLRPDLVLWISDGGALAAVRRVAELSQASSRPFPVVAIPVVSVADVLATPRIVGEALGAPAAGARLSAELAAEVERVRARAASLPRRRALFLVGREPLVVAGPGSFPDELLRIAGAVNVVGGSRPWPVFPLERAVALDPEVVVDGAPQEPAEGIVRLSAIPAVRRGAVVRLPDDALLRPGPRMIRGLETLFRGLHPEAR